MTRGRHRWLWLGIAVAAIALPALAWARPGGGDSYSGGGGHGGGGGGGGGGDGGALFELIFQLIRLCFYYPKVGIPILLIIIGLIAYGSYVKHKNKDWDSGPPVDLARTAVTLDELVRVDPDFSRVLFEDFVYRLYATAHGARGAPGKLDELAPYVSAEARHQLATRPPTGQPVTGVVVGAMRVYRVEVPSADDVAAGTGTHVRVGVEFEANYSVGTGDGSRRFAVERWLLTRAVGARTRPPGKDRSFPCPNCGAPWQTTDAAGTQKCASCGEIVDNGRFDWQVVDIGLRHERDNIPGLDEDTQERGTDLPTYRDAALDQRWMTLCAEDPGVAEASIIARLHFIYQQLNDAWTRNDVAAVRGVVSDGMADYLQYWLDAYRRQGLRNVLADMRITHQVPARLVRDRYYDALTIRIWGTGKDYVIKTSDGSLVRGSKHRERAYSEYWTLIRSAGRRGATRTDGACSNCGAPLVVTQAGACGHCGTHVTSGEFDWVLSKIEQDDSYRG